jgi:hypothetical protein
MKKTAVEWLSEKLFNDFGFSFSNNILEQAKEMEKQQIIDAFNYGQIDLGMEADEYHKQIFKSE